ncbi:MAG: hypothetical protein M1835_004649 [Candelina submexicana]|nr:MAG: hypothetical protein M1835_004649 [Candelina submexicana]
MPSSSYFSLPLRPSKGLEFRRNPKKRKRGDEDTNNESEEEESSFVNGSGNGAGSTAAGVSTSRGQSSTNSAPVKEASLSMAPGDAHQYLISGQPFNQPLPKGNFPHTPLSSVSDPAGAGTDMEWKHIRSELASLNPPLYVPIKSRIRSTKRSTPAGESGLRRQHLSVLTTLLNRLLCEGDFARASRAFGLLLRSHGVGGADVDIRKQGYWGIGAEILFRRDRTTAGQKKTSKSENYEEGGCDRAVKASNMTFNKEGFAEAKDYYERLILQYPYRKTAPNATSALDFYPAMFGLWIYATQQEFKIARKLLDEGSEESEKQGTEDDEDVDGEEKEALSPIQRMQHENQQYEQRDEIRRSEMQQAEEIAARLDELLLSPPYSDSPELRQLQTSLSLWIADLAVPEVPPVHGSEDDQEEDRPGWISEPDG